MAHVNAVPPFRRVSSRPISLENASHMLEKYLLNSEVHPHLHPDSVITTAGATFSSHGGPLGGVVMHNLRRVAAGLRGEYLEPEATPEPEEQVEQEANATSRKGKKGKSRREDAAVGLDEDWVNFSEYEREERIENEGQETNEVGEIGQRTNVVEQGGEMPEIEPMDDFEMNEGGMKKRKKDAKEGTIDKAARKKAKKERNKELKAKKEKARAGKST